ncbi:MAG: beta-lactamase family protein, partial [Cyclobacteriaceae bacterium]|nr:beta-lactamase family protein [Cyclobacteriaceae bacterium]
MNTKPTLFLILFFSGQLFLSCQKRENTAATPEAVESKKSVLFSDTYHPPLFSNTDRLENLKNALPEVEEIYRKYAIENHYPGIVYGIVLDGELVFSGGEGVINLEDHTPVTERSLFRIASMTKSFTAMAIMKLLEVGKLQLSDPASKYIPELDSVRYLTRDATPVTVYNLLTMSAGFPEDNPWGDRQLDDTDEELLALIKDGISFSNIPSQEYEYSNLGYAILGHIVSRVSGMPYQQYITRNILAPLDMENTRWEYAEVPDSLLALGYRWEENTWKPEPLLHDGSFGAMGGLITSIEDFSKYVAFHLSAWPPRNDPDEGPVKR